MTKGVFQLGNSCLDDSAAFVERRRKVQTKTNQNFCKISSVEKLGDCIIVGKNKVTSKMNHL